MSLLSLARESAWWKRVRAYVPFDLGYFLHGGFRLGAGQVATMILSFALSLVLVNGLPTETYGQYKYILSLFAFLSIPGLTELGGGVIRSVARGFDRSLWDGVRLKAKGGVIACIIGGAAAVYYIRSGNEILGLSLAIGAFVVPLSDTLRLYDAWFQGKRQFGRSAMWGTLVQFVMTVALMTATLLTSRLPLLFLVSYGASIVIYAGVMWHLSRVVPAHGAEDPELRSYSFHLSAIKALGTIGGNVSSVLLFHLFGGASLATAAVAMAPIEQARGFLVLGENLLLPKMAEPGWSLGSFRSFVKKIMPVLVTVVLGIVVYVVIAPVFFQIFFPKYLYVVQYSRLYAVSLFWTAIQIMLVTVLKARHALRELHVMNSIDVICGVVFAVPLVYAYGVLGYILALMVNKILLTGVLFYFLFRRQRSNA